MSKRKPGRIITFISAAIWLGVVTSGCMERPVPLAIPPQIVVSTIREAVNFNRDWKFARGNPPGAEARILTTLDGKLCICRMIGRFRDRLIPERTVTPGSCPGKVWAGIERWSHSTGPIAVSGCILISTALWRFQRFT